MYQSGWDADAHLGRVERPVEPDRVDLGQAAERGEHRGDEEEQADRLGRVGRPQPLADDVVLACGPARELRVLLAHEDREVRAEQHGDERRDEQDVDDEEPGDDVGAGELAAEQRATPATCPTSGIDSAIE